MIIDPTGSDYYSWAVSVSQQLGLNGDTVRVELGKDWSDWAREILMLPQISYQLAPRPDNFANWLDWANAFNQAVRY